MTEIRRNTDLVNGPEDGVEVDVNCIVTKFEDVSQAEGNISQEQAQCHVVCSYSEGLIGFSVRSMNLMLTVRMDELMEVMVAAGKAAWDVRGEEDPQVQEMPVLTDEYLEELWEELADVPFDEADSPSGLVLTNPWLHFPAGVDREEIWRFFDENHSRGVAYLFGFTDDGGLE